MHCLHILNISHPAGVALAALFGSALIRTVLSFLRLLAANERSWKNFGYLFMGFQSVPRKGLAGLREMQYWQPDYGHPWLIGVFELFAFPYLLAGNMLNFIGAWIGLKTIAQWKRWQDDRVIFNLFLIGQALVLGLSYIIRRWMF